MALCTNKDGKKLRVVAPDYLYNYPTFRRVKLAAVKHQMLRPDLPSIRRMERDNMLRKLSDEHVRTTTTCSAQDFRQLTVMNDLIPPAKELHCMECTETGHMLRKKYFTPLDVQRQGLIWQKYMNNPMVVAAVSTKKTPPVEPRPVRDKNCGCDGAKNLQFDGAPLRYKKADLRNWRFSLKDEPRLIGYAQQPLPSDLNFPRDIKPHPQSIKQHRYL
ncbi:testis, prostate and placenta-expressed protein [Elysia marginata]|uniref:Testis, prostate and placenta-expressed protein n=1 Tax=Elysia marginata TaxID=1093978 RepID=A0AAV4GTB6_9GAST|nr:testis, prostate and placenta-expressed protein [Elysia marginata]